MRLSGFRSGLRLLRGFGWKTSDNRSIVNLFIYSHLGTIFHKSCDTLGISNDENLLSDKMLTICEELDPDNIVHIVMDNGSTFKKVGEDASLVYLWIFWTSYLVHCIDLIIKDEKGERLRVSTTRYVDVHSDTSMSDTDGDNDGGSGEQGGHEYWGLMGEDATDGSSAPVPLGFVPKETHVQDNQAGTIDTPTYGGTNMPLHGAIDALDKPFYYWEGSLYRQVAWTPYLTI